MTSLDAYEKNLAQRLDELRQGDPAYDMHCDAIYETLPYEAADAPHTDSTRILDVGCGLGFLTARLATWPGTDVVGVDPSAPAIELAKKEHADIQNLTFQAGNVTDLETEPFDRAIVNMVLHSVDDETCLDILASTRDMLKQPGILTAIVPGQDWLANKLRASAESRGMEGREAFSWVIDKMHEDEVSIDFGISGQPAYKEPITVYNRSLKDYGKLLIRSGFGFDINAFDPHTGEYIKQIACAYWEWSDHTAGHSLVTKDRHILMTTQRITPTE